MELDLELAEAPSLKSAAQVQLSGPNPLDGTRVLEVSSTLADELGLGDLAGVVVAAVPNGSIAQGLGIRPGDVLLRVNGTRIADIGGLQTAIQRPRQLWNMDIRRGSQIYRLAVRG